MIRTKRQRLNDGADLEPILIDDDTDDLSSDLNEPSNGNTRRKKKRSSKIVVAKQMNPDHNENTQHDTKPVIDDQSTANTDNSTDASSENESIITLATLLPDCLDEIFNFLSLADVKSVGNTCKELHKITADHFKLKYPAKKLKIRKPLSYFIPNTTNGFGPFYRNIFIDDGDIQVFDMLTKTCENPLKNPLNKIQFSQKTHRKKISNGFGARIKNHLKTVASIEFLGCKIDGELHQLILQFTENLQRLSIRNYAHEGVYIGINDDWLRRKYRTLQHLALVKNPTEIEQLKTFFDRNRHIKSFTTTMAIIWLNKTVFQANSVNLNELNVELSLDDKSHLQLYVEFLNKLHRLSRYKYLKLRLIDASFLTENVEHIATLNGLNGIYFDCDVIINAELTTALASFEQLTTLYIRQPIEADATAKGNLHSANLKAIYMQTIKTELFVDQILPIVRQSPKIRKIFIRKINGNLDLKIIKTNEIRIKLKDAAQLKVFVDDEIFLSIRRKYTDIELPAIELKRSESDLTNHPFALHGE